MACTAATWSPASLQLRLALKCGGWTGPRAVLVQASLRKLNREMRLFSVGRRGSRLERSRNCAAWIRSESDPDAFSGWLESDNDEESIESKNKKSSGIRGIVGAGIAGAVIFAGLVFAATSLRSTSRTKPQMKHLTTDESSYVEKDNGGLESKTSISKAPSSSEFDYRSIDNIQDNGGASNPYDLENGSDATPSLPGSSDSGIASGSSVTSNLKDSESNYDSLSPEPTLQFEGNLGTDHQDEFIGLNSSSIEAGSDSGSEPQFVPKENVEIIVSPSAKDNSDISKLSHISEDGKTSSVEMNNLSESQLPETTSLPVSSKSLFEFSTPKNSFSPAGIPAPSLVSTARLVDPGKVLVPSVVDPVQGQAIAALQVLKVIEPDALPSDLCTRREYARWLVTASSFLTRNTVSKVYPAMYIENVTELAFDDITPEDPDFSSIQGLAEAGLISSKLSNHDLLNEDQGPFYFSPESSLSRQDLVSWKMALEKIRLPEADRKTLYELSGFMDIGRINPQAWPALVADLSSGEQGITALAFGCTRLFQPDKPVTKAQAAIALATGEASDAVSEELARIEAESMAEKAVSAHNALVAEVEQDINASFEKELMTEKEKIDAVEKMAEEAKRELEWLREERVKDRAALMKEQAAIESEMKLFSRLKQEVEEQMESLVSKKVEITYDKERINKLRVETENESQEITRLQNELEAERKAMSMARAWAEDEAKRAKEQAKALEEARSRWERHGIKVVVDSELQQEADAADTWLNAGKRISMEGRARTLVNKLKAMARNVEENSKQFINKIIDTIVRLVSVLKERVSQAAAKVEELKNMSIEQGRESLQELKQNTVEFGSTVREGIEKLSQKFKT